MATDDRDTDDETDERAGPDSERAPESPGTYANAGREEDQTRQQAGDARDDELSESDAHRAQTGRGQPERRYGAERSGTDQPSRPSRPSRRYGSKQQTGGRDEQIDGREEQIQGQDKREDIWNDSEGGRTAERPHEGEPRRTEEPPRGSESPQSGDSRRGGGLERGTESQRSGESPQRRDPQQGETPNRTEQTPPKRTQPLREPGEPETGDHGPAAGTGAERRGEAGSGRGEREGMSGRDDPDESEQQSDVPKYGGPHDPSGDRGRGQSVERQRRQREYERQFDRQQARQRDFQRDKSGGKYRRR